MHGKCEHGGGNTSSTVLAAECLGMSDPSSQAAAMADSARGTLRVARVLVESRRPVDLGGLQNAIGRLCAAVFDLEPAEGRRLRPQLEAVLAELNALETSLHLSSGYGQEQ
jgi:hypothetical protein